MKPVTVINSTRKSSSNEMRRQVLLGDEAVALAAIHAGVSGAYAYPGTPSTEILETIQKYARRMPDDHPIHAMHWSANEKTAYEAALGHSYAGRRAIVAFKHVGLNVAMDPFMSSAITGANGGLVIAVADDPGMHSSQSEQDSRFLADFAQIPCLEPWDQQTAYDWTREAFELSEEFGVPVMVRLVTRLAHSRAAIHVGKAIPQPRRPVCSEWREWTLMPSNARPNYRRLLDKQAPIRRRLSESQWFEFDREGDRSCGVIACGLARNYLEEAFERRDLRHPTLTVGAYPVPNDLLRELLHLCERILIVEDGMPFMERRLNAAMLTESVRLIGRRTGDLPVAGELTPDAVARALGARVDPIEMSYDRRTQLPVANRPPQLCQGCSHIDVFTAIKDLLGKDHEGRVFGDIGCYTLAALPPYDMLETCVDMGASIPMAIGASQAGLHPAIAVIGDSTFAHSGMTGLLDAVTMNANITVIISDNGTTAMTGGQPDPATGEALVDICAGLGVPREHIHYIDANKAHHDDMVKALKAELDHPGPSVLICKRPCIHSSGVERSLKAELAEAELVRQRVTTDGLQAVTAPEDVSVAEATRRREPFKRNIVLAGVGGQGILSIAQVITLNAARAGLSVKQAETHGMSQRGGAVVSHLRFSNGPLHSDLIERGTADVLLAVEPLEALRWQSFLKPSGRFIVSVTPVLNIPDYPELEQLLDVIRESPDHTLIDADRLAASAGTVRAANMVMLGAAAKWLGFDDKEWERALTEIWSRKGPRVVETNFKAFRYGRDARDFYTALVEGGIRPKRALIISSSTEPRPDTARFVKAWRRRLAADDAGDLLERLSASRKLSSPDPNEISLESGRRP